LLEQEDDAPTSMEYGIDLHPRRGTFCLRAVGVALPLLYVWCLPKLASVHFAHKCVWIYPWCHPVGRNVSDFIANTRSTGAMAVVFFFLCLNMWLNASYVRNKSWVYPTLIAFQFGFGGFLASPLPEVPAVHTVFVALFCVAGQMHFGVMLKHCAEDCVWCCTALLYIGWVCLFFVMSLNIYATIDSDLLPNHYPWLDWFFESMGITSMGLFSLFWYRKDSSCARSFE